MRSKSRRLSEAARLEENTTKPPPQKTNPSAPTETICDVCQQIGAPNESVR